MYADILKQKLHAIMNWLGLSKIKRPKGLLLIVIMASAGMIIMNYYTIRILSSARAYINGESEYSKGQKDASAHLINYIYLQNQADYIKFEKDISVPIGDRQARLALLEGNDRGQAEKGFLQAKNHPQDINDLIWLFNTFKHVPMFKKAISIWTSGDTMVNKLYQLGIQSHGKFSSGEILPAEKKSLIRSISNISEELTIKEDAFSETLGEISRTIDLYLFLTDVLISLIIIISSLSYAGTMIRSLDNSKMKIVEQNESLQVINAGLDKFVYNITHDLRSPLVALIGLIDIIDDESDPAQIKDYTLMMKASLEKQDQFINEMLTFIKSKHTGLVKEECSLNYIIDSVMSQNYQYRNSKNEIRFYKEVELDSFTSDGLKIQVILNNLVSNSIKYSDPKKEIQWVKLKTYRRQADAVIEVEDNGLGIRQRDQERIFDKFYLSGTNKRSSGLGLYLVKDAVTQMNGRIEVQSEVGEYSKFTISIPG